MPGFRKYFAGSFELVLGGAFHACGNQAIGLRRFDHQAEGVFIHAQEAGTIAIFALCVHQAENPRAEIHPGIDVGGADT
jgi:hypothetical protein